MALENISEVANITLNPFDLGFWTGLSPEIASKISSLITILQITGIVIVGYIIFLIIKWIFSVRRHKKISKIYRKVNEIDRKLDLLLAKSRLREIEKKVKETPMQRKRGLFHKLLFKKRKKKLKNKR